MKVVLIQPFYFNIWEALGLAYIAAYAKQYFKGKIDFRFYQGYFDDDKTIVEGARSADLVAFSCTSPAYGAAVRLAGTIKAINPSVRTVFGGFHPSAIPDQCILEDSVDQVIVGEGETAFLSVLNGNRSPVIYSDKLLNVDDVFPDRDLIRNIRTVDLCQEQVGQRITSFQSVRVCPFQCAFCSERVITGVYDRKTNPVRVRDPRHLVEEIKLVAKKYALDHFKFVDATWNTSPEKVIGFCEEKIRQNVHLPWDANIHAAFASREMLEAMKAAGCGLINVGCESGSQRILNDIGKGLVVDKIKRVFQWGRELGLERRGFFLLGMPNETVEDIRLTEKLVEEIQPDIFGVTILCPYPGTDFYDAASMRDYDWSLADEYSNSYWHTRHFSNAQLKQWQEVLTGKYADKLAWHHKILKKRRGNA